MGGGPAAVRQPRPGGWYLLNLSVTDIAPLADGTGWAVERHHIAGPDHYVAFRRQ